MTIRSFTLALLLIPVCLLPLSAKAAPTGPASLPITGAPGEPVSADIQVSSDAPPMQVLTDIGTVTPEEITEASAFFNFSYTIPANAQDGEIIPGSITVSDDTGDLVIPVTITVAGAGTGSEPEPEPVLEPLSASIASITRNALQGSMLTVEFTVRSDSQPMFVDTTMAFAQITPGQINATSGTVTFTFDVPEVAADEQVFEGSITILDSLSELTIPVTITVAPPLLGEQENLTARQRTLAGALDQACPALRDIPAEERTSGQQDLLATCDRAEASADPRGLYDNLAPEEVAAQGRMSTQSLRQQLGNIDTRLNELRAGARGVSTNGLSIAHNGQRLPMQVFTSALGLGGGASDDILAFSKWGGFFNGSAAFGNRSRTDNEQGYRTRTLGLTTGVDFRFTARTIAGVALGYTHTDTDLRDNAGGVDVNGYSLSLYGTHFLPNAFYMDGSATIGRKDYDTTRTVFRGPAGQSALARPDGTELALGLNVGFDHAAGAWSLGAQTSFDYMRLSIDSYRERASNPDNPGAGSLLEIGSQSIESLTAEAALQVSYAQSQPWGVLIYSGRGGVTREFSNDSRRINARFLEDPSSTSFSLRTDDPNRTFLRIGAGLTAQMTRGRAAYIFVETLEDAGPFSLYLVDVGLRMEF